MLDSLTNLVYFHGWATGLSVFLASMDCIASNKQQIFLDQTDQFLILTHVDRG